LQTYRRTKVLNNGQGRGGEGVLAATVVVLI